MAKHVPSLEEQVAWAYRMVERIQEFTAQRPGGFSKHSPYQWGRFIRQIDRELSKEEEESDAA